VFGPDEFEYFPSIRGAAIGAQVPDGIPLQPISTTLATLIPETAQYDVAMVEKQVVLVDPQGKKVVAVIAREP